MRVRFTLLSIAAVLIIALSPAGAAATDTPASPGPAPTPMPGPGPTPTPGPPPPPVPVPGPGRYINPFANPHWQPSRIDMGVDWIETRRLPVLAIGKALIIGSQDHAGWPGHHIIWYELLNGSHAGDVIYVAEHLTHLTPVGTIVKAGQRIATALPGYPWTEWGWADTYGSPRAYRCYKEGKVTNSGKEMARFLSSLGARLAVTAGAGPSSPKGRRC